MRPDKTKLYRYETFGNFTPLRDDISYLTDARAFVSTVADTWSSFLDLEEAAKQNQTMSDADRQKYLLEEAKSVQKRLSNRAEELKTVLQGCAKISRSLIAKAKKPTDPAAEMRRHSVRASLKELPPQERMELVRESLMNNDEDVIDAIACSSRFESGVNELHYSEAHAAFVKNHCGMALDELEHWQHAIDAIDHAQGQLTKLLRDNYVNRGVEILNAENNARLAKEKLDEQLREVESDNNGSKE